MVHQPDAGPPGGPVTLEQFDLHRPRLARELRRCIEEAQYDGNPWVPGRWEVHPRYTSVLFEVTLEGLEQYICVGPDHPLAQIEEEAPGVATWWHVSNVPDEFLK